MRDTGGASASLDTQLGNRCRNGEHIILELRMRSSTRNRVAQVAPRVTLPSTVSGRAWEGGPMAGTPSTPMCECDCGVLGAGRHLLSDAPPDGPWPLCVCPHCGPAPAQEGGRRQCTTAVHPIVAVFTPGGLLLCEECRASCHRWMRNAKRMKHGRDGDKRKNQAGVSEGHDNSETGDNHPEVTGGVPAE